MNIYLDFFFFKQKTAYEMLRSLVGSEMCIRDRCNDLIDKQRTFYTRLCLSAPEDSEAADMKERINLMSKAFGFENLYECLDKLTETLDAARKKELDT